MRFKDAVWRRELGGLWACASLLHVSSFEFPTVALRLMATPGAWHHLRVIQKGVGERNEGGRYFTGHTNGTLRRVAERMNVEIIELLSSGDVHPFRVGVQWINLITRAQSTARFPSASQNLSVC
jgi:hypothetical protein